MRPRRPVSVEVLEARRLFAAGVPAAEAVRAPVGATVAAASVGIAAVGAEIQFATAGQTVSNAGGTVLVTVFRGNDTSGEVSVNYSTANGTAQAGVDYTSKSGILTFFAGETEKSFTVTLANRPYAPAAQTFTVNLSPPSPGAYLGTNASHTVTLQNDRAPVTLSAAAYAATTDDAGVDVVVTRAGNTAAAVSVAYATTDGTALAGVDYTDADGTLSFLAGETSKTVNVPLLSNFHAADGVQFGFALFNPADGAVLIGTSSATVAIGNSHSPIRLDSAAYAATTDDENLLVTVTRTGNTALTATVDYATADGTAVTGTDYVAAGGGFSFGPGETVKTFNIPLAGNVEAAGDVEFSVALSSPGGSALLLAPSSATVEIQNPYSPLRFSAATYSASTDDATVTLTVDRTGNLSVPASVEYSTDDLTAEAGLDYDLTSGTLVFAPGEASKNIVVPLGGNFHAADGSEFHVALSGGTGGAVLETPAEATVTIANDHAPIEFDVSSYTFSTTDATATLTVRRTGNTAGAVTVQYATGDGSARDEVDYAAASGTIHFAAGETVETIDIPLLHNYGGTDGVVLSVALSAPGGGAELGATDSATVSIANLQSLLAFDVANYAVDVRLDTVTLEVVRVGNLSFPASVDFVTVDGTAVDGEDYFGTSGTLFFDVGEASQFVEVSVIGDAASPASRGFSVVLATPAGNGVVGAPDTATVDIQNAESVVQFAAAGYTVLASAGDVTLALTRVGNTSVPLAVEYATVDGTAADGTDYAAANGTVFFAAGQSSGSIIVPVFVNSSGPAAVTFGVNLSNPVGGVIGGTASTIVTVDNVYSVVAVTAPVMTVANDAGAASVSVARTGNLGLAATVNYTTFSETAVAGTDYTPATGVLTFSPGESSKTVLVTVAVNAAAPAGLEFGVVISSGSSSTLIHPADTTRVTITNAYSVVGFASAAVAATESDGTVTFTLSRVGNLNHPVSVGIATTDATAAAGLDYTAGAGTVAFVAGQATATFSVAVNPDLDFDPNESFGVTLTNPAGGAVLGAANAAAATLADTSPPPTFSGGGLVATQRPGRLDGVSIAFDQALQAPPVAAFSLFQRSGDQPGGGAKLRPVAINNAAYDPAARAVTVRPMRPMKANVFYQLVVNADLIQNLGGLKLDGAGTGQGSALVVNFGQGKKLRYVDHDGDTVQLVLKGPGVMELVRRADGEGERLTLSGTTAATKLLGTVRPTRMGGDGHTTLAALAGLGAATSLLAPAQFGIEEIA